MSAAPADPASLERPWLSAYPPGVPADYRIPDVAVTRLLDDAARDFPTRPALVTDVGVLDHATMRDRVDTLATLLADSGLGAGDRLLVGLPSGALIPIVLLAAWRLGAVAVVLSPQASTRELVAVARDAHAAALVAERRIVATLADDEVLPPVVLAGDGDPWSDGSRVARLRVPARRLAARLRRASRWPEGARDLAEALADVTPRTPPTPPVPGALALLAYPSTGPAHGVALTHANLVAAAFQARLWIPDMQAGRERTLVADHLHDVAVLTAGFLATLLAAGASVLLDDPEASGLARAIERESPTLMVASPRRITDLVSGGDSRRDLTALRVVLAIGSRLEPAAAVELERRTDGARVRQAYGLGEAAPLTHAQPVYGRVVPGSLGVPVTGTTALVVDPDDLGVVREADEPGRLLVAGDQVAAGHWRRPELDERRFVGDWVVGDELVVMDAGGVLRRIGDIDVTLRRGGLVLAATDIEQVLQEHPGVERAGVVLTDPDHQLVAAVVTRRRRQRAQPDELRAHCHRLLDAQAVPDRVVLVDELPTTAAGELARDLLRRMLSEGRPR